MHTAMSFLIDSNIVIAAEPYDGRLEELQSTVSTFLRLTSEHGHKVYVHPATRDDLTETTNPAHRNQNLAAYDKYPHLTEVAIRAGVDAVFPSPRSANDQRDARILAALDSGAVHFLVTNDAKLRRRATKVGLEHRALSPQLAVEQLAAWHPQAPAPPPTVTELKTYELDTTQQVFDSLRASYAVFDTWIASAKLDSTNRRAWVVLGPGGDYEALAIVKARDTHPVIASEEAIKLSTFKVAQGAAGRRLGELLLKTVLRWANTEPGRPGELFVEVNDGVDRLQDFLTDFGFTPGPMKNGHASEQIWLKELDPQADSNLGGLEHHVSYGPPALRANQPVFLIPIIPAWYEDLFPDADVLGPSGIVPMAGTNPDPKPYGNAIRKAYLSRSPTREVPKGATLLFYRSQGAVSGDGAVVAVGVAEKSLRTADPVETIEFSFKRTVYSEEDVAKLHADGHEVLTILFRHDRFISRPWTVDMLVANSVVKSPPQSVTRVKDPKGVAWIEQQLNAWP